MIVHGFNHILRVLKSPSGPDSKQVCIHKVFSAHGVQELLRLWTRNHDACR